MPLRVKRVTQAKQNFYNGIFEFELIQDLLVNIAEIAIIYNSNLSLCSNLYLLVIDYILAYIFGTSVSEKII